MLKRWTEAVRPICPMSLKSGDKACYAQCLHSFKDGENKEGEQLYGCMMGDEVALNVEKLKRELTVVDDAHIQAHERADAALNPPKKRGRKTKAEVPDARE